MKETKFPTDGRTNFNSYLGLKYTFILGEYEYTTLGIFKAILFCGIFIQILYGIDFFTDNLSMLY